MENQSLFHAVSLFKQLRLCVCMYVYLCAYAALYLLLVPGCPQCPLIEVFIDVTVIATKGGVQDLIGNVKGVNEGYSLMSHGLQERVQLLPGQ